jgi:hypothetical protein
MKSYDFNGLKKTLKKNTFELEEQVKDVVGANEKNEQKILLFQKEFESISKEYSNRLPKPNKKRKEQIEKRLIEINQEIVAISQNLRWSDKFETCISVVDVLFIEGSVGLTKSNFGRFDAEQAWKDFFTAPTPNEDE